jgi:leucyl aminopeptidase
MEIKVLAGNIAEIKVDAVLVSVFEGAERLEGAAAGIDRALDGVVAQLISQGEIKGKPNEVTIIHSLGKLPAARVAVLGLGKPAELARDKIGNGIAEACRILRQKGVTSIATATHGVGSAGISLEGSAQAIAEGALLGLYLFRRHLTRKEPEPGEIKEFSILAAEGSEIPSLEAGCRRGRVLAEATNLARDMVNEPANYMTPTAMAEQAKKLAESYGLEIDVLERAEMEKLGMGALLGVAQGSEQPPKFIVLRYRGGTGDFEVALLGKGLTFDSGGISIKSSEKMDEMKGDMAGGAAVMAALGAIAQLGAKINVMALVPATENLPSGRALKPGDVVTALDGKTIEIISTDAEGRLILADALGYARKAGVSRIIDVATLTGSCRVALGDICTGAFANNQELVDKVIVAGAEAGELIWQMPMFKQYQEQNKSDIADIKNCGSRYGGAITAAQFLAEFVGDTPWVHLDIAGTFLSEKECGFLVKGATGVPVRTLVNLVLALAES